MSVWLAVVSPARADDRVEGPGAEAEAAAGLAEARLGHREERFDLGVALLVGGGTSILAGATIAIAQRDDPLWLSFGVGTGVWGAVNAGLALGLFDLSGAERRRIDEAEGLRGSELASERLAALRAEESSATFFVFNLGLDFFYIGTGVLLAVVASQLDGDDEGFLRGYGVAQAIQGTFLLAFDFVGWWTALARADDIAEVPGPTRWQ